MGSINWLCQILELFLRSNSKLKRERSELWCKALRRKMPEREWKTTAFAFGQNAVIPQRIVINRTYLYIDVRLVAHGLVPLTLRQNDILTFEKWRPFYTIWKKDAAQTLHKRASFVQCFIKQIVLFRSARFKGSLLVRPGTLWTYVHRAKDVRP